MRKHIPNIITLTNLFCGCCAALFVFYEQYSLAISFITAALVADFLDGLVARQLGVHSSLGKELDSLADLISFGLVPGAIAFTFLCEGLEIDPLKSFPLAALPAFMLPVFAALRLAKFNLDKRQLTVFMGLPTPSCTIFFAGLLLAFHFDTFDLGHHIANPILIYVCIAIFSVLMVSEIPMFSLKLGGLKLNENKEKFVFLIIFILALLLVRAFAFSLMILLYVCYSIYLHLFSPKSQT
ncbi:MAG: CDP-alcohol phosphatidyltransferase family protein [Saprospiraceae bacterium]|nr:CDP-alcohol phosphatidyltransferase family protein [Saprospiraceae bacterium]